jgi:transposase
MEPISNNTLAEPSPVKRRRRHSAAFKAEVLTACSEPGASISAVARRYQLNANLVQKWRKAARDSGGSLTQSPEFVPIPLAMSAPADLDVRVTLIIGNLTIQWPLSHINQALPWLKGNRSF